MANFYYPDKWIIARLNFNQNRTIGCVIQCYFQISAFDHREKICFMPLIKFKFSSSQIAIPVWNVNTYTYLINLMTFGSLRTLLINVRCWFEWKWKPLFRMYDKCMVARWNALHIFIFVGKLRSLKTSRLPFPLVITG